MSIFQIICLVLLAVAFVVFAIYAYLEKEGVDEAEFIGVLLAAVCIAIGLFSLLLGAIGWLIWSV